MKPYYEGARATIYHGEAEERWCEAAARRLEQAVFDFGAGADGPHFGEERGRGAQA